MSASSLDEERTRVVAAAHALLAEEDAAPGFTIDALAARAGVARAQVQRRFGTPTRVLEALWDQLLSDHCLALLPNAFERTEPTAVLAELIAIYGRCWHGQRRVIRRIKACAAFDPELERALRTRELERRVGLRRFAERMARGGSMRVPDGVDVVEVLALSTAFELFDSLAGPERPIEQVIPAAQGIAARMLGW
jgi:AcrR family transcriptional regulator